METVITIENPDVPQTVIMIYRFHVSVRFLLPGFIYGSFLVTKEV